MELENTKGLTAEEIKHKQFTKVVIENDELTKKNKRLLKENFALLELDRKHIESKIVLQDEIRGLYNYIYLLNGGDINTMNRVHAVDKSKVTP